MVQLVNLKESLIIFYQKRENIIRPLLKVLLAFAVLCLTQAVFPYNSAVNRPLLFLLVALVQAFLPITFLYYAASFLIMMNLWTVSADVFLGFVLLFLICLLTFVRNDGKMGVVTVLIPVLFYLKLEYLIPVILAVTGGFATILPVVCGTLIYYLGFYTKDASTLLTYSADSDAGMGLSYIVSLMAADRTLLVILVTFFLVIFVTSLLYRMFYERAWLFAIAVGNAAMAFLLLCGRFIFELDFTIWRVFLEALLSFLICLIIQFFRGIGDISRMERTSFEDDDYIYYVKAVPKIKVTQKKRNVTNIKSEEAEEDMEEE